MTEAREQRCPTYFIDTEFIENGNCHPLELLSIGIACEDGREFYAVNSEADLTHANDWVKANVLPLLGTPRLNRLTTFAEPCTICQGSCHNAVFDPLPSGERVSAEPVPVTSLSSADFVGACGAQGISLDPFAAAHPKVAGRKGRPIDDDTPSVTLAEPAGGAAKETHEQHQEFGNVREVQAGDSIGAGSQGSHHRRTEPSESAPLSVEGCTLTPHGQGYGAVGASPASTGRSASVLTAEKREKDRAGGAAAVEEAMTAEQFFTRVLSEKNQPCLNSAMSFGFTDAERDVIFEFAEAYAASRTRALDGEPCSMAAHPFTRHGAKGYCEVRGEPCPRSCLLKTVGIRDSEIEGMKVLAKVDRERTRALEEALRMAYEWEKDCPRFEAVCPKCQWRKKAESLLSPSPQNGS